MPDYEVYVNGTNVFNVISTINQNLTVTSYPMCTCGAHRVSVNAVNRCGGKGQDTSVITLDPEQALPPVPKCEDTSTSQSTGGQKCDFLGIDHQ